MAAAQPLQRTNFSPVAGKAVSVTTAPLPKTAAQAQLKLQN
jgi:hypothetical protein